jgi:hypothetical protein
MAVICSSSDFIRDYKGLGPAARCLLPDDRIRQMKVKLAGGLASFLWRPAENIFDQEKRAETCRNIIWSKRLHTQTARWGGPTSVPANMVVLPYKSAHTERRDAGGFSIFEKPMLVDQCGRTVGDCARRARWGYVVEPDAHRIADAIVGLHRQTTARRLFTETDAAGEN